MLPTNTCESAAVCCPQLVVAFGSMLESCSWFDKSKLGQTTSPGSREHNPSGSNCKSWLGSWPFSKATSLKGGNIDEHPLVALITTADSKVSKPDWSGVASKEKDRAAVTAKNNTKAQGSQLLSKLKKLWSLLRN